MAMLTGHLAARGLTGADAEAFVFQAPGGGPLHYSNWLLRGWHPACVSSGQTGLGAAMNTAKVAEGST